MTKDEFKVQFKRLCDGFSFQPTPGQIEAFFERLGFHDVRDWKEAVTDLLCAPRFPKDLNVIAETVGKRADDRRRLEAERKRMERVSMPQPEPGTFRTRDGWDGMGFPPEIRESLEKLGLLSPKDGQA